MSIDTYPTPADVTLGTMAVQNANNVAITNGSGAFSALSTSGNFSTGGSVSVGTNLGVTTTGYFGTDVTVVGKIGAGTTPTYPLDVLGNVRVTSKVLIGTEYGYATRLQIHWDRATQHGMSFLTTADTGANQTITFLNAAGINNGSITQTVSAVAYNTSSDIRLKHAVQALGNALSAIQALRPVRFRWNADDSTDEGFLAHELQQVIPHAVTGEPDALNDDGSIRPQQVDHSKLVPWLTAALQETIAQVQALTARVADLEALIAA